MLGTKIKKGNNPKEQALKDMRECGVSLKYILYGAVLHTFFTENIVF